MQHKLIDHIDFLMQMALLKCGNTDEARDLCQDTLLSALKYMASDNRIEDIRSYLVIVLNRRFHDRLRQKYNKPVVYQDVPGEMADDSDLEEDLLYKEQAQEIRKQIAYLTDTYRNVIIRYYLKGESVKYISESLNIPQGTVKSRLSGGRTQLKKGFECMESYTKQSYEPINMSVSNSGNSSLKGEPRSLVEGDLIAQNLLYLAYNEPVTPQELAKAIGIPMAYIEPIIKKLVEGELMKQAGTKVYTDFMLLSVKDMEQYIPAQKEFIGEHFERFWDKTQSGIDRIRQMDCYQRFNQNQRNALELYSLFYIYDRGLYEAFSKIYDAKQTFPERPNGGKWIAFGHVTPQNFDMSKHMDLLKHSYSGERWTYMKNYLGAKQIGMHVYDPDGFPIRIYYRGENGIFDDELVKLLHVIHDEINPEETGFDTESLKSIPYLCECKILRNDKGKISLDIPVFTMEEKQEFYEILKDAKSNMIVDVMDILREFFKDKKIGIPKHLTSVPVQKQYAWSYSAMIFILIRTAMSKNLVHDGGYDNEVQCPYPMFFVTDR